MKEISSSDNPAMKKLALLSQKKQRDRQGCYIIEGPNLLREALKNQVRPQVVFFRSSCTTGGANSEYSELLYHLSQRSVEVAVVSEAVFDRAAQTDTPQGVMAVVEKRYWTEEEFFGGRPRGGADPPQRVQDGNVLVLDRLQDPGNLGTVLRTADGAGFSGALLMKGCGDIYSPKVVRACTGTLFRLPVFSCETPQEALALLHKYHKKVFATSLENSKLYYECDLRENVALVIGNEGNGVCSEFLNEADGLLTIPMAGNLESLNAAVAAGILMYEAVRQRNGG